MACESWPRSLNTKLNREIAVRFRKRFHFFPVPSWFPEERFRQFRFPAPRPSWKKSSFGQRSSLVWSLSQIMLVMIFRAWKELVSSPSATCMRAPHANLSLPLVLFSLDAGKRVPEEKRTIAVHITIQIGNMVTGNHFWGVNSMGLPEPRAVWGDVNWWRTRITGNTGNAITGKYSGRINLEQLPEKSVIGNPWLPEKCLTN